METGTIESNKVILKKLYISAFFVMCMVELLNSAAAITDSYFIGNYIGSMGMAAMGYANPFFSFVDIICGPLGLGMQLVCSHYIGKGDIDSAQKTFSGSLTIGIAAAAALALFGVFRTQFFASLYGREGAAAAVVPLAEKYLKGLFIGTPAMVAFGILAPVVQLGNGKRLIVESVVFQFVGDVVGDALSVFMFDGGMFGLGLATAASYYMALIPLIFYFFRSDVILKLRLSFMPVSDFRGIWDSGLSRAIQRVCSTIKPLILNGLSLLLGTALALSAYNVTNQVRSVLISFSAGATGAAVLIGALLFSQGDRDGLKCLSEISMKAVGFTALLGLICICLSSRIAGLFISDSEEVLKMASLSIRCVGIMIPFATFNGTVISFMQITKRYSLGNKLSYLNRLILIVITSAVFGLIFGTDGLWWALPVSEIINAVITLLIIKKQNGRFPRETVDFMCLDPDFGFKKEDYIEISISIPEDVLALQKGVERFCEEHDIDYRRTYFAQLALEELAANVIEHGFPQCRKDPVIHIWITYDKRDLFIRIQDNCPNFNVMKFCSDIQQESSDRCVGLRLVSKISKEMNYMNIMDTNNLVIRI